MKNKMIKIKNSSSRILAMFLTLCVVLVLFTGCTFGVSNNECDDPNCTSCAHVVYAAEYPIDYTSATSMSWVDCPDCVDGGEYVISTRICSTCEGEGSISGSNQITCPTCTGTGIGVSYVECVACGGDGNFVCPKCNGLKYFTENNENFGCDGCGGNGLRMDGQGTAGTGKVDCLNCVNGFYTSSRCGDCNGNGVKTNYYSYSCPVTACDNGVITSKTWVECQTCFGDEGWYVDEGEEPCDHCGFSHLQTCPDCNGYGFVTVNGENFGCTTCGGNGERMSSLQGKAGTGSIDCSYCTDSTYYSVEFICVDYDDYGFEDYSVTVKGGEVIPSVLGWSEDTYYFATTSAGTTQISKDSVVTDDMTIYVHIIGVNETHDVKYYELAYNTTSSYYIRCATEIFPAGNTLTAYIADDFIDGILGSDKNTYEFLGWHVSDVDLKLSYDIINDYKDYFDADDICTLADYDVTDDMYLYAVYGEPADDSSILGGFFDNDFGFDFSNIVSFVIITIVVLGLILLIVIFK